MSNWLNIRRATAAASLNEVALPTADLEVWRYSPIDELDLSRYAPIESPSAADPAVAHELVPTDRAALVVVRDDAIVHLEVSDAAAAAGLAITPFSELADEPEHLGQAVSEPDALTLRNDAFGASGIYIAVARNAVIDGPVVVVHDVTVDGSLTLPRVLVDAETSSQVTVLDVALSADIDALILPVIELHAAANATLRYQSIQALGPRVWQIGTTGARVDRDGHLTSAAVALGGGYARTRLDSKVVGPGAETELVAAYFGSGTHIHDFRTLQDHHAAKTTSELLFKGVLTDTSRSVYSGLIRIRPGAAGSAAFQTNRNLVLGEGAHADSVPNLEIEENDVKCSHASAVGPVDADQQYYLEARGVPSEIAERLIVLGFFDDVLERTPVEALRAPLRGAVAQKLTMSGAVA
ncbi:MAG: SufD family Fe-S cluster assembly protein [Actinobacteria bacterium]|nr:SufD family Fe-S cluster assembly protein [Actinomycetota bacterium]